MLVESFRHDGRRNSCFYGFAGRNAQQTLGLLLTKRMEAGGLGPLGVRGHRLRHADLGAWSRHRPGPLFEPAALRENFDVWLRATR